MQTIGPPRTLKLVVDRHRAASQGFEALKQSMKQWIGIGMHSLNPRRVIDVRYRGNVKTHNVEFVDTEKCLLWESWRGGA